MSIPDRHKKAPSPTENKKPAVLFDTQGNRFIFISNSKNFRRYALFFK